MVTKINDDFFAKEILADPFAYYNRLREEDPVHWNEKYETWVVTRYDDVVTVARHPEIYSSEKEIRDTRPAYPPVAPEDEHHLRFVRGIRSHEFIRNDPPNHRRMRREIHNYFSPKAVEVWRQMVRDIINESLDAVADRGHMDVAVDLAAPLPLRVISELLGVEPEDRALVRDMALRRMSNAINLDPYRMRRAAEAIRQIMDYLTPKLDRRLISPEDDLLSMLAKGEKKGVYTREEALSNAMQLIDAGHHTTINLICNGTLAFMRNPKQWGLLKNDLSLAVRATEECLRYDPPVPTLTRLVLEETTLRGKTIRKGDRLRAEVISANRDPRIFSNPDTFDIMRTPNHHVAFGSGVHYCLGQYLARLEGQEVFSALAKRFPSMRMTSEVVYEPNRESHNVLSLPLAWDIKA